MLIERRWVGSMYLQLAGTLEGSVHKQSSVLLLPLRCNCMFPKEPGTQEA